MLYKFLILQQLKYYSSLPLFLCLGLIAICQQKITGIVLSDDNLPLFGTTVTLKSSGLSTITLSDGSLFIIDPVKSEKHYLRRFNPFIMVFEYFK